MVAILDELQFILAILTNHIPKLPKIQYTVRRLLIHG